ncbi:MAG: hypothetical protein IJ757_00530 [Clostridiales bacterium]|nr:hypothetical protein [Clostridiales bacterium]
MKINDVIYDDDAYIRGVIIKDLGEGYYNVFWFNYVIGIVSEDEENLKVIGHYNGDPKMFDDQEAREAMNRYLLEKRLADKYSFMRRDRSLAEQSKEGFIDDLYSAFGCECDDGWFPLLDELCADITRVYEDAGLPVGIKVDQVKEKFGGLRFYVTATGPQELVKEVYRLINEAEGKSEKICEHCGNPGIIRNDLAWIRCLCDECYEKKMKENLQ